VLVSIGTAYLVMQFKSIMDYVQALFSFFIAPLFGTILLGMLWKRGTRQGGFWGLLAGTLSSIGFFIWVKEVPSALSYIALSTHAKPMAENMYRALWSWCICVVVTVVVSLLTKPKPVAELTGPGLRLTPGALGRASAHLQTVHFLGRGGGAGLVVLQWIFW